MTPNQLEQRFLPLIRRRSSLTLLPAAEAIRLLKESAFCDVKLLGVESFRIFDDGGPNDGGIQPSTEYSNLCWGIFKDNEFQWDMGLQTHFKDSEDPLGDTIELINKGSKAGFDWIEVHLLDPVTNLELFFLEDEE